VQRIQLKFGKVLIRGYDKIPSTISDWFDLFRTLK
jgi:hypothetical protein